MKKKITRKLKFIIKNKEKTTKNVENMNEFDYETIE